MFLTTADVECYEPCPGCLVFFDFCHSFIRHPCKKKSPWVEKRKRELRRRVAEEYDRAITICNKTKYRDSGLFCIDNLDYLLQDAQDSGLFCLDNTERHVVAACDSGDFFLDVMENAAAKNVVVQLPSVSFEQGCITNISSTNNKRPQSMIS